VRISSAAAAESRIVSGRALGSTTTSIVMSSPIERRVLLPPD
jgi:hypothetical protein